MTTDEAQKKWCPLVRLQGDHADELGTNRTKSGRIPDAACCIADDCMMWVPEMLRRNGNFIEVNGGCCGLIRW